MDLPFFVDKIPDGAEYCRRSEFSERFTLGTFQVLDPRIQPDDLIAISERTYKPQIRSFFEIKDIQLSTMEARALCSMSIFKPSSVYKSGRSWHQYVEGLEDWIQYYRARMRVRQYQKLRVYVGDSAWDDLYRAGILKAKDVDFIRMEDSSHHTAVGQLWRFLAFDDYSYDYVYTQDVDGEGEWVDRRWQRQPKDWEIVTRYGLKGLASRVGDCHIGTLMLPFPPVEHRDDSIPDDECPFFFWVQDARLSEPFFCHRLSEYMQSVSPWVVRGNRRLPFKMVDILCYYLESDAPLTVYDPNSHCWTTIRQRHPNLNHRYIDEHWLFHLSKVIQVKNIVRRVDYPLLRKLTLKYGGTYFLKRFHDHLIADGNVLVLEDNEENGNPFSHIINTR